ncbi:MAG: hypothetical protein K1X55_00900 [Chitinophagales bacterium]|nr:hypothetical protein [Chitinophagales bacterium]
MKQDGLESFIRKNKGSFDKAAWDKDAIWQRLETELTQQPTKKGKMIDFFKNKWWQRSVAAVFVLGACFWLYNRQNNVSEKPIEVCSIKGVPATFCSEVINYEKTFQEKVKLLDKKALKEIDIPEVVINEITLTHHEQKELIDELRNNPQNKMVQEALIEYYQAKIKLLDRLEKSIDINKKYNNEKNHSDISI